jgi:sirohydrochlorin cobaltochelatase
VRRIYDATDEVAARHPDIEFVKAPYLNDHPLVLETFVERVHEILQGRNLMNCQMCKYREQVLGFEAEVGLPQESHHHHVEGIGTGIAGAAGPGAAPRPFTGEEPPASAHSAAHAAGEHAHHHDGGHRHHHSHDHHGNGGHDHRHDDGHHHHHAAHGHHHHNGAHGHHHPYPHADHPLGPRSLKRG